MYRISTYIIRFYLQIIYYIVSSIVRTKLYKNESTDHNWQFYNVKYCNDIMKGYSRALQ